MNKINRMAVVTALASLALGAVGPAQAQANVGVSININQPGVYGRINFGDMPPPMVVLPQPVVIYQPRVVVERPPIYLYVPTAHQQDWRRYCGRYSACGQPVYFVQERWVRERYEAQHPGWDRGRHRGWEKKAERKADRRDDRHEERGDHDDRGDRGKGHGKGHGKD